MIPRRCLSNDRACSGLAPCEACRRQLRAMALAPALVALGLRARDQVRDLLAEAVDEEAAASFEERYPVGFLTEEMARTALVAFDEGLERCLHLPIPPPSGKAGAKPKERRPPTAPEEETKAETKTG